MKRILAILGLPGLFIACGLLLAGLTRLVLAVAARQELDPGLYNLAGVFLTGFAYDLATACYALLPLLLFRVLLPAPVLASRPLRVFSAVLLHAGLCLLLFVAVAEWFFWDEFKARFNFIAVDYLIYRREVTDNILESYPVYPVLALIAVLAAAITAVLMRKTRAVAPAGFLQRKAAFVVVVLLACGSFAWLNDGGRARFGNAYARELASNGIYQFFSAFRNSELDYDTYYVKANDELTSQRLQQLLHNTPPADAGLYRIGRTIQARGEEQRLNVVLVVIESLSAKFVGAYGSGDTLTPNLDALAAQSLVFDNFYATGTRTIRGLEAITLSIPPTPGQSIVRRPDNEGLFNIGTPFQQRGYDATFFYGGNGYFDNMNAFFAGGGFNILDRTDIADTDVTFSNAWGVADEDIYRQVIRRASADWAAQKPFFSVVMTTSNHRPYTYPDGRIDIPSGAGRRGAVKYTDYAIGQFLAEARRQPWFASTVFVFVADHCAGVAGKSALPVKDYHIPLLVYSPLHVPAGHVGVLSGQMDIAPTLLGMLNFSYHSWFFGRNVLEETPGQGLALISNYQNIGLLGPELLTVLEPQKRVEQFADPFGEERRLHGIANRSQLEDTIAYYQGANHVWHQRLSRVNADTVVASDHKPTAGDRRG